MSSPVGGFESCMMKALGLSEIHPVTQGWYMYANEHTIYTVKKKGCFDSIWLATSSASLNTVESLY